MNIDEVTRAFIASIIYFWSAAPTLPDYRCSL